MASLQIGRTFARAGSLFAGAFPGIGMFALAMSAISAAKQFFVQYQLFGASPPNPAAVTAMFSSGWYWGSSLASILLAAFAFAGGIGGMVSLSGGKPPSFGDCVTIGLRKFVPALLVTVLMWLGIVLGMVVLFVPGIILMTMWAAALQVAIAEDAGVGEAFGRSRAMTKGSRWKILALVIIAGAVVVALAVGAMRVAGISAASPLMSPALMLPMALVGTVSSLLLNALLVAIYIELSEDRGVAEVFS